MNQQLTIPSPKAAPTPLYSILPDGRWEFFFDNHTMSVWETCGRKFDFQILPHDWVLGSVTRTLSPNGTGFTETNFSRGVVKQRGMLPWKMQLGIWWSAVMSDFYEAIRTGVLTKRLNAISAVTRWTEHNMDSYAATNPSEYLKFGGGAFTPVLVGSGQSPNDPRQTIKIPYGAIGMANEYYDRYAIQDSTEWTVLATESGFGLAKEVLVGENDKVVVHSTGRPDLVVLEKRTWILDIIDHKSTETLDQRWASGFKPGNQFPGYIFAVRSIIEGLGKDGRQVKNRFMVNGAARTETPANSKTKGGPPPRFKRIPISYTESEIAEWQRSVLECAMEMRRAIETDYFPPRKTSCHSQWGRPCEYRDICAAPPEQRLIVIKSLYKIDEPWSPYKLEQKIKTEQENTNAGTRTTENTVTEPTRTGGETSA